MTSEVVVLAHRDKEKDGALVSSDEEEEDEDVSPLLLGQASDDDDDDEEYDDGNAGVAGGKTKNKNGRHEPPRPSMLQKNVLRASSILPTNNKRNRRRSSARFLDMRGGGRRSSIGSLASNKSTSSSTTVISKKSLGDMYKRVIRMNAENRINASNSWNLKLIDNIDKFLLVDDDDDDDDADDDSFDKQQQTPHQQQSQQNHHGGGGGGGGRVNFTKASCTLDASVKIYSYRVDDVHLTSYKVLANLHRTDNNNKSKKKGSNGDDDDNDDMDDGGETGGNKTKARSNNSNNKPAGPTLESNLGNLNLSRLDSAFDIDPLFHKMSTTFDEGGAKGLLLANLGVGREGCDIVFDSTENLDQDGEAETKKNTNGMVDISSLTAKLDATLSLFELSLVPQLSGLRAEYSQLDEDGFVETDALTMSASRSRRFAPEPEEEKEADRSIHQEAMERSAHRASQAHSFTRNDDENNDDTGKTPRGGGDDDDEYGADDYGGGYNDDDDDDDHAFVNFMATDTNASRFSSASFTGSVSQQHPFEEDASQQTTVLLDAMAAGKLGIGQSEYEYFDASQVNDNAWAGATHWKRASIAATAKTPTKARRRESSRAKATPKKSAKKKKATGAASKIGDRVLVNLLQTPADLEDILRKPPAARKGQRAGAVDPLQLTTVAKLTKTDNLLPLDVGIGIEVLSSLFLRPDAAIFKQQLQKVASSAASAGAPVKAVGFNMDQVQTFGDASPWDNGGGHGGTYAEGDDDGGAGYDMGGGDDNDDDDDGGDFFVQELDNVRKVEKVSVGYATVAKKVDVKRLKRDLWAEIESHFDKGSGNDSDVEKKDDDDDNYTNGATVAAAATPHSFQQAVKEMEANKTQVDVTLPYYFICLLHLANEQNLRLESKGLDDFEIHLDNDIEND